MIYTWRTASRSLPGGRRNGFGPSQDNRNTLRTGFCPGFCLGGAQCPSDQKPYIAWKRQTAICHISALP
eukprot:9551961-Lingulodinium_polyedra.AAC.1